MSFSKSRKAAWRSRVSGDPSDLYSLRDYQTFEVSLWQQPTQVDLSLHMPSRPERLVIIDDGSSNKSYMSEEYRPESCTCKEDVGRLASPVLVTHPSSCEEQLSANVELCQALSHRHEIITLATICMVQIIPLSALGTSFPTAEVIAASFRITDSSQLPWTTAAYALTFGSCILIAGRLGDIFGHKRMVILGFVIMSLSSLLAGLSIHSTYVLYFTARALQGVGSALMQPNGLALLGRMYPPNTRKKNFAFALFGAMAAPGAYLGMLFGALLARKPTWIWASYALAITAGICAALAHIILVPQSRAPTDHQSFFSKLQAMDWAGAVTGVTGLVCIAIAWIQAPSLGWSTQYIYMLFIVGAISMAGFVLIEHRVATHPLVPSTTLKPEMVLILTAVGLGWASFGIWVFYLWQFLLHLRGLSPIAVAVQVAPVVPMGFIANATTGMLMNTAKPSLILCYSLFAFTTAALFIAISPVVQSYWSLTFVSLLIVPFGMDMSFPAATVTISNSLPSHQQGIAGSLVATVINYGMSLGLGFASTVQHYVGQHGRDPLAGYRGAFYMSIGLGGMGTFIAAAFFFKDLLEGRRTRRPVDNRPRLRKRGSRNGSQMTLRLPRYDLFGLTKRLSNIARTQDQPLPGRTAEAPGGRIGTVMLWEQHPAVRPLGGAELVARE